MKSITAILILLLYSLFIYSQNLIVDGSVGIWTSEVGKSLEVYGNILTKSSPVGGYATARSTGDDGVTSFWMNSNYNPANHTSGWKRIMNFKEGGVGIGTLNTSLSLFTVYDESHFSAIYGQSASGTGVRGSSGNSYGVYGISFGSYGVSGYSLQHHGSVFQGKKEEGFADIILGAKDGTGAGDNGVIMSDPNYPNSDMLLIANDAVVIKIDNNENSSGNFNVQDGDGDVLFQVDESGTVSLKNSFLQRSDRNSKDHITNLNYSKILQAVTDMPIYEWQYKEINRRHIGPMAQDFHKAFGLGDDDKTIASIDADGVALAAIKAQQEIIEVLQSRLEKQENELKVIKELLKVQLSFSNEE